MILPIKMVIVDPQIISFCAHPYDGHKKGCPNLGKKVTCPPFHKMFVPDMENPMYAIINEFPLYTHVERLRLLYPSWTERQLYCCLYWQPKARKQLQAEIKRFLNDHADYSVDTCPEAGAVNVTETLRLIGISLEWPPRYRAIQVAIATRNKEPYET
jgi:hypothetical protein